MNDQTDRSRLTAVLCKFTAALMSVFLAAASAGAAEQTGGPAPAARASASATSDVPASITLKTNGTSYIYHLSDNEGSYAAGQAKPRGRHHKKQYRCRWGFDGITCD